MNRFVGIGLFATLSAAAPTPNDLGMVVTGTQCSAAIAAFAGDERLDMHRLYFPPPPGEDQEIMNCGAAAPCDSGTFLLRATSGDSAQRLIEKHIKKYPSKGRGSRERYISWCLNDRRAVKDMSRIERQRMTSAIVELDDRDRQNLRNHRKFGKYLH